jgi:adenosylcobinamide-phosphate guanylyltransferase
MAVTALVMAGGKASRMNSSTEKPLLKVRGGTMLERVVQVLQQSRLVDRIVVAVTERSPRTALAARRLGLEIIQTPGDGYESDMRWAIRKLELDDVLLISVDLPSVTVKIIDEAIDRFRSSGKPALSVMTPIELYERHGLAAQYVLEIAGRRMVPIGINLIDGRKIEGGELEQEVLVSEDDSTFLNVNTPRELQLARRWSKKMMPR